MSVSNIYRVAFHFESGGVTTPGTSPQSALVLIANPLAAGFALTPDDGAILTILNASGPAVPSGAAIKLDGIGTVMERVLT